MIGNAKLTGGSTNQAISHDKVDEITENSNGPRVTSGGTGNTYTTPDEAFSSEPTDTGSDVSADPGSRQHFQQISNKQEDNLGEVKNRNKKRSNLQQVSNRQEENVVTDVVDAGAPGIATREHARTIIDSNGDAKGGSSTPAPEYAGLENSDGDLNNGNGKVKDLMDPERANKWLQNVTGRKDGDITPTVNPQNNPVGPDGNGDTPLWMIALGIALLVVTGIGAKLTEAI